MFTQRGVSGAYGGFYLACLLYDFSAGGTLLSLALRRFWIKHGWEVFEGGVRLLLWRGEGVSKCQIYIFQLKTSMLVHNSSPIPSLSHLSLFLYSVFN